MRQIIYRIGIDSRGEEEVETLNKKQQKGGYENGNSG
jgi:hypothetical protein